MLSVGKPKSVKRRPKNSQKPICGLPARAHTPRVSKKSHEAYRSLPRPPQSPCVLRSTPQSAHNPHARTLVGFAQYLSNPPRDAPQCARTDGIWNSTKTQLRILLKNLWRKPKTQFSENVNSPRTAVHARVPHARAPHSQHRPPSSTLHSPSLLLPLFSSCSIGCHMGGEGVGWGI